jgi:hypothetical protein
MLNPLTPSAPAPSSLAPPQAVNATTAANSGASCHAERETDVFMGGGPLLQETGGAIWPGFG